MRFVEIRKQNYHAIDRPREGGEKKLGLQPAAVAIAMVDLADQCRLTSDDFIDVAGRTPPALEQSAEQVNRGPRDR